MSYELRTPGIKELPKYIPNSEFRANLNKSEKLVTNTTTGSKYNVHTIKRTYLKGPAFASIEIPPQINFSNSYYFWDIFSSTRS